MSNTTIYEENQNEKILGNKLVNNSLGLLGDFFEISDKAQEGGMGEVFFCRDKRDNKFYVLKAATIDTKLTDIFKKECLFVLDLWKHPNIVYSRTIISDKDKLYIVMEFIGKQPYNLLESIQGETLTRVMNKSKIEPKQALIWAIQFCQGMQYLNSRKMLTHKDIKPDNILISPDNTIKITDFGLASIEKKGGTIGYRPPEYFDDKKDLTIQSDIYSFGLVLYQMLNNNVLLSAKTNWNKDTKEYVFVDENTLESKHCQDIIRKCLQKDITKRYNNFEELEKDLTLYLKQNYPEYQLPKLKAEEMTANDYFLKGLGYYILEEKLKAFLLFSLAIFENPKFAEAYYYRSKIKLFPKIIHILLAILPLVLITIISLWAYSLIVKKQVLSSLIWQTITVYFLYWIIGFLWLSYEASQVFGWKTFKGIKFILSHFLYVAWNMDLVIYKKLKN